MKYRELQTRKDAPSNHYLENEDRFIHFYGQFNCKILKFKDANTVVNLMQKEDQTYLGVNEKEFIVKNSNKEVLCYICHSYEDRPDIFVYGDDNIAFTVDCFV